jgi:hypothetical protein
MHVELSWFSPFAVDSFSALVNGVLLGVFIYWGWDSGVAVNEESQDAANGPGKAAIVSTSCSWRSTSSSRWPARPTAARRR